MSTWFKNYLSKILQISKTLVWISFLDFILCLIKYEPFQMLSVCLVLTLQLWGVMMFGSIFYSFLAEFMLFFVKLVSEMLPRPNLMRQHIACHVCLLNYKEKCSTSYLWTVDINVSVVFLSRVSWQVIYHTCGLISVINN